MIIRDAEKNDGIPLAELLSELGSALSSDDIENKLHHMTASSDNTVLVATADGVMAGCLTGHVYDVLHAEGRMGRITALVVRNGHRGKGIGKALIASATSFFRQQGCKRLEVTSKSHRTAAHRFYTTLGFEENAKRFVIRLLDNGFDE